MSSGVAFSSCDRMVEALDVVPPGRGSKERVAVFHECVDQQNCCYSCCGDAAWVSTIRCTSLATISQRCRATPTPHTTASQYNAAWDCQRCQNLPGTVHLQGLVAHSLLHASAARISSTTQPHPGSRSLPACNTNPHTVMRPFCGGSNGRRAGCVVPCPGHPTQPYSLSSA